VATAVIRIEQIRTHGGKTCCEPPECMPRDEPVSYRMYCDATQLMPMSDLLMHRELKGPATWTKLYRMAHVPNSG
jgi:hypothetical protein